MKRFFSLIVVLPFLTGKLHAQPAQEQRIQDSIIGWWSNNRFDKYIKPTNDPVQKNRIAQLDKLVSWMKHTYTPVGGLGTSTRENNDGFYGVRFLVWNVSFAKPWLDEKGHFKPISEENTPFGIHFNSVPSSYTAYYMNGVTGDYYFTWPVDGYNSYERKKPADPRIHPNAYPYITRINETHNVILAPNNQLPFVPVTIKEYLDISEASLSKELAKKKKEIDEHWPGNNAKDAESRSSAYASQEKEFQRYRNAIAKWRDKYKNSLSNFAVLRHMQPTLISEFFGDMDPLEISDLEKSRSNSFPLYKVPTDIAKKATSDKPQWIAIWFPYATRENGNQLYELYKAMSENLNYTYIYNYFFDPAKVQGKPYAPANEQQLKDRLASYKKNSGAITAPTSAPLSAGVHFMDDFSGNAIGSKPAGWYFSTYGKFIETVTVPGQPGQWARLGNQNDFVPVYMKKPLPTNFSLEFDVATDPFSGRTGGAVSLYMSTYPTAENGRENRSGNGKSFTLKIHPGLEDAFRAGSNYLGETTLEIHSTPVVNTENHSEGLYVKYPAGEFTNSKRKIHVTLQLKNGNLTVSLNNKQVIGENDFKLRYGGNCTNCQVLEGAKIHTLAWRDITQDWSRFSDDKNVQVYITNIKITQL